MNRYALTQPQRNRVITAAVPHPNNSAKSHKPQSTQRTQRPHQRIIGLSRTGLTFARPLWSLCSIWLKSVVCNPIKPICDEYKPGYSLFSMGELESQIICILLYLGEPRSWPNHRGAEEQRLYSLPDLTHIIQRRLFSWNLLLMCQQRYQSPDDRAFPMENQKKSNARG